MNEVRGTTVISKQVIGNAPIGTKFKVHIWGVKYTGGGKPIFNYDAVSVKKIGIHHVGYSDEFLTMDEMNKDFNTMFDTVPG